jgi:hypothetical protein
LDSSFGISVAEAGIVDSHRRNCDSFEHPSDFEVEIGVAEAGNMIPAQTP